MVDPFADVQAAVAARGYIFVPATDMGAMLTMAGFRDWDGFSRSWDDLGLDTYMADGGRYRRRRYAAFSVTRGGSIRKPHQPHYQSRDYNPLNGGIERWFDPITEATARHPAFALRHAHISESGNSLEEITFLRHSREGGNPDLLTGFILQTLDPRLRGDDGRSYI